MRFIRSRELVTAALTAITFIVFAGSPLQTFALSAAQKSVFDNGVLYFNTDGIPGSGDNNCSSNTTGTGTDISTLTAGSGAPDGAAFPNLSPTAMANAINAWIVQQNPSSKLSGLGPTIVAGAKNSNVSPFLITAIAKEETSMADPTSYNVKYANNAFSREATSSQPNYPGAGTNAGTLWYKWSSVAASVDNTAPENQNVAGGGDFAAYLRAQYGSQIDNNNLAAMFLVYAPPGQNNTAQYISNVQSWVSDLVNLSNGSSTSTSNSLSGATGETNASTCSGSTSTCTNDGGTSTGPNAAILCEAEKYEGIYYELGGGHESYSTFRDQCPENAISAAAASSTTDSPGPCATDCSGLVSVAVDGAFNQSFVWTVSNTNGQMIGDGSQYWQSIPIAQAQAGDIVTTTSPDGHVEIVDHVNGNNIVTVGSHETGVKTSSVTLSTSYWVTGAWRWTGPGSSQ